MRVSGRCNRGRRDGELQEGVKGANGPSDLVTHRPQIDSTRGGLAMDTSDKPVAIQVKLQLRCTCRHVRI